MGKRPLGQGPEHERFTAGLNSAGPDVAFCNLKNYTENPCLHSGKPVRSEVDLEYDPIVHKFVNIRTMDSKYIYRLHAEVCKALGHPTRIEVVEVLSKSELCFSDILEQVGGLKSTLSQNLSVMVDAGILKVRKESRCNYYSLTSNKVYKACQLMRELLIKNLERQNTVLSKIKSEL